ncbi:MAG: methylamine utilization protein [Armatimonadetes bacterium]|nr:methylamine utilization protein [Armatimonadota bacterium]
MARRVPLILTAAIAAVPWLVLSLPTDDPADVPTLPDVPYKYADSDVDLPPHFRAFSANPGSYDNIDNTPRNNPTTNAGATLGRVLFYDKRLSASDTVACGSCHLQKHGFSDPRPLSVGFDGKETKRHSLPLVNVRYYENGRMFWDERAPTLEKQVLMPIQSAIEMGMTLDGLVAKLSSAEFYGPLFKDAFGTEKVTSDRIARAIAQFVRSLVSYESKFDRALAAPSTGDVLTEQEQRGHKLFTGTPRPGSLERFIRTGPELGLATCANCHITEIQTGDGLRNNGLDPDLSLDPGTNGFFKAPSLRNVAVRTAFMHDGRFSTLREVVEHYSTGIKAHPRLILLRGRGGRPLRPDLSDEDIEALVAFMLTLTDEKFLTDPKFSNPFAK